MLVMGACRLCGIVTRAAQTLREHAATHRYGQKGAVVGTRGWLATGHLLTYYDTSSVEGHVSMAREARVSCTSATCNLCSQLFDISL